MEFREQATERTLARKLGDIAHMSGLAIRLARQSGAGERLPEWLFKVAVERGAKHYRRDFDPLLPRDNSAISDEEVGIALCLNEHTYTLDHLRAAAQLLSSPGANPQQLCRLAVQERAEPVLLHIANLTREFAPELEPWAYVREHLPPRKVPHADALPHWSRFVSHTGVTAFGGPPRTDWLRRHE